MTDFQKSLTRFMYVTLVLAVVVAAWLLVRPATLGQRAADTGYGRYAQYGPGVTATGTCVVRTKPDLVEVSVGVQQSGSSARAVNGYVKSKIREVIKTLSKGGVAAKDIQTQSFSLAPEWDRDHHVVKWHGNESLRVRVRKIDDVANLVDAAIKAGANNVGGLLYTVDDLNKLRAMGRKKASKVARDKAAQLASSLGGELGRLVSVDETYPGDSYSYWDGYPYYRSSYAAANVQAQVVTGPPETPDAASEELTIQPGQMVLTVVVRATYELE